MSLVVLASGGLDSTLVSLMAQEGGLDFMPLFINYGQIGATKEWTACKLLYPRYSMPEVTKMDISNFGKIVPSGITDVTRRINEDAFLPGRNLLLLLCGAAYAFSKQADCVAIGLLNPKYSLFPDQTEEFLRKTENLIELALGKRVSVSAPLIDFSKADILSMANERNLQDTYSCHAGGDEPCGKCIACIEIANAREWSV